MLASWQSVKCQSEGSLKLYRSVGYIIAYIHGDSMIVINNPQIGLVKQILLKEVTVIKSSSKTALYNIA